MKVAGEIAVVEPEITPNAQLGLPRSPIPSALMVSEPGSFAQYTLRERLPAIIQQAISDNSFAPASVANLEALATELLNGVIRPIRADSGVDGVAWSAYVSPYVGRSWFDTPFYFAEAYFYRRMLAAIAYFEAAPSHRCDPFAHQKHLSLTTATTAIRTIAMQLRGAGLDGAIQGTSSSKHRVAHLVRLLHLALWGNRVDLSLWTASNRDRIRTQVEQDEANILINHSADIAQQLSQTQHARFDLIMDNAGFECVCDLFLIDFLLTTGIAETIALHLKPYPIFVSDATIPDLHHTLEWLAADAEATVRSLANRLQQALAVGRLSLQTDDFWAAPLPFWEMPAALGQVFAPSCRVLIKGDANYRRLVGDCHWAMTTPLENIVNYFPASLVALRTLKSEVIVGLRSPQITWLNQTDPKWLINGQWGIIQQFSTKRQ